MLTQDVRFAARMLWKDPGFTIVATIALALGIGASTAIFSVVHAVLVRPLPYSDPATIVEVNETARGGLMTVSPPNFLDWKADTRTFAALAAYNDLTTTLSGGFEPERLDAAVVGAEVFEVLGVGPALGRGFGPAEERPGGPRTVVLGHGLWQRRFGGDPSILGRSVTFNGQRYEIVGVMPRGFTFPDGIDLWFPLVLTEEDTRPNQRGAHYLSAIGRLKPGVTPQQAIEDLTAIEQAIAARHSSVQGYGIWVRPLLDSMVGSVRRPLLMLLGAVAFVLLIACVNVSNLLIARGSTRRGEIAIRSALGAGRWRIVRQLLAESLMLSLAGGAAGVLLAAWGIRVLVALLPQDLPRADGIDVNGTVLGFSLAVSVLTGVFFGVAPALSASKPDLASFLKQARRDGPASGGRRGFRNTLIAIEVALALVLLAGAGLSMRSFARLSSVDPGFDPAGVLAVSISLPEGRYTNTSSVARFYADLIEAVAGQPGIVAAGAVMMPPLSAGGFGGTFSIRGRDDSDDQRMQVRAATAGYFEALRIPLRRGRLFTAHDRETSVPVAVISEEAARRFWPGADPIGQRIRIHVSVVGIRETEREIVGVVGNVKTRTLERASPPVAYVPHAQYAAESMTVFVQTTGDPLAVLPVVKSQLGLLDGTVALARVRPAERIVAAAVAQPRFRTVLLGLFAAIALLLAAVGLYGVTAFSVSHRRAELAMRMALGAERGDVLRLVLIQSLVPVAFGIAVGLVGAAVLSRVMSNLLFEISRFDPITFCVVPLVLGAVAAAACFIPARRATTLDPLIALRAE
jgi:putative ABC transport system permease protein